MPQVQFIFEFPSGAYFTINFLTKTGVRIL